LTTGNNNSTGSSTNAGGSGSGRTYTYSSPSYSYSSGSGYRPSRPATGSTATTGNSAATGAAASASSTTTTTAAKPARKSSTVRKTTKSVTSTTIDEANVPTKSGLGNANTDASKVSSDFVLDRDDKYQNRMDPASDVMLTSSIEGSSIGSSMIPVKAPNKLMVLGIVLFGFFSMVLATILKFFVFAPVKKRKDEEEDKKNA
jgi:hypothetical protein